MASIQIQGIDCSYRDLLPDEEVLYIDLPQEDQVFKRTEYPFTDDDLVAIANKEHSYTGLQKSWVEKEKKRMDYGNGVYASINGKLTYIPASYWGYVNYWTLENGKKPDYRESDRRFFLFKEYICFETPVLAVTRGKGRRKGATSQGAFWEWWICGRNEEKIGGMISFNDDAAQAVYQKMFMRGFTELLPCFVEDFDSSSENFIRFVKPVEKKKKGVPIKREGLNSYVGFKSNAINSYDSGRVSYGLFDESGKYEKMDINTYWSKVSATLKEGINKVGFAYLPTTVNPRKKGGENYKKFWGLCNQNAVNPKTGEVYGLKTPNKAVRYLDPATEGYAGCIDKFGESVILDPGEPIMGNDGNWITKGSLSTILEERALLEGEQLMEHRRDFPLDEHDMFAFETGMCEFNEENFIKQKRWLEENPVYLRRCRLYRVQVVKKNLFTQKDEVWDEITYMDDDKGEWLLYEEPDKPNHYDHRGNIRALNGLRYSIGVDTVKGGFTANGSTATICVFKKSHIINGEEKGLYPVALYTGKPRLIQHLNEQVLMACMWFGSKVNYEIDAGTSFYDYFLSKDAALFLEWTPRIAIDVTKKHPLIKPGTESANPYQFAMQLEVAKKYFDGTIVGGYNGNVHRIVFLIILTQGLEYDHEDRTKSDIIIALMMALLPCFGSVDYAKEPTKPTRILPQYKIKMAQ